MIAKKNDSVNDENDNSSKPLLVIVFGKVRLWFTKEFGVLTIEECEKLDLSHCHNVYGLSIEELNCRSIWRNKKGKSYRCDSLV
jgi:hypothetical protein